MDNGLIFPYPRAAVRAGPPDAKRPDLVFLRERGGGPRTEGAVGKPLEGRRRAALPGGGCPGVRM